MPLAGNRVSSCARTHLALLVDGLDYNPHRQRTTLDDDDDGGAHLVLSTGTDGEYHITENGHTVDMICLT